MLIGAVAMSAWILREPDISYLNAKSGNSEIELRIIKKGQICWRRDWNTALEKYIGQKFIINIVISGDN